jgi:hypothetical protein
MMISGDRMKIIRRKWLFLAMLFLSFVAGSGAVYWRWFHAPARPAGEQEEIALEQVRQSLDSPSLQENVDVQELLFRWQASLPQTPIPHDEIFKLLVGLLNHPYTALRAEAAQALAHLKITPAAPYLLEVLQFESPFSPIYEDLVSAYQELSGLAWSYEIDGWAREFERWWSLHPQAPLEFLVWKIQLFRNLVPSFDEFLYPGVTHTIPLEHVVWGGVAKDSIAALNMPKVISVAEAEYLQEGEMIFGVYLNGEARAYPLRFLDWHELVNDELGGEPIVLSYCTLCGSAILYSRRINNGRVLSFGTSGLLYKSNKLMYDAETKTLWINFLGEPVVGSLAIQEDLQLEALPLTQTTWSRWKTEHPETTVLAPLIKSARSGQAQIIGPGGGELYAPGSAYREYRQSSETFFPVIERDARLAPKDWVYGLLLDGQAIAYPLELLRERGILNDAVRDLAIIVEDGIVGMDHWKQGGAVRAYASAGVILRREADGEIRDEAGQLWKLAENFLWNEATGEKLPRLNGHKAYWFAWVAFYPATALYGETER